MLLRLTLKALKLDEFRARLLFITYHILIKLLLINVHNNNQYLHNDHKNVQSYATLLNDSDKLKIKHTLETSIALDKMLEDISTTNGTSPTSGTELNSTPLTVSLQQ